jgi:uncharacterized membrane protein YadS
MCVLTCLWSEKKKRLKQLMQSYSNNENPLYIVLPLRTSLLNSTLLVPSKMLSLPALTSRLSMLKRTVGSRMKLSLLKLLSLTRKVTSLLSLLTVMMVSVPVLLLKVLPSSDLLSTRMVPPLPVMPLKFLMVLLLSC